MTAAGAIVKRGSKIPADEVWAGLPAKFLKQREPVPEKTAPKQPKREGS
jgi:carbonic anhydrase/acetyltransferase-like protein (isoleucine patch superfamily)